MTTPSQTSRICCQEVVGVKSLQTLTSYLGSAWHERLKQMLNPSPEWLDHHDSLWEQACGCQKASVDLTLCSQVT